MIELHPEILRKDGKPQFAILSWDEFQRVQEALEDADDLRELRAAKAVTEGEPTISLEKLKAELDLDSK